MLMLGDGPAILSGLTDTQHLARVAVRLVIAMILGGIVGFEREFEHKAAGMRTHMLVALGSALFVLIAVEARMTTADMSRIIQGLTTGVGFIGAGTIFKLTDQHEVKGLTTAANLWVTAAAGAGVGAGWVWPAVLTIVLVWIILFVFGRIEGRMRRQGH